MKTFPQGGAVSCQIVAPFFPLVWKPGFYFRKGLSVPFPEMYLLELLYPNKCIPGTPGYDPCGVNGP